jgi:hypothetical protein
VKQNSKVLVLYRMGPSPVDIHHNEGILLATAVTRTGLDGDGQGLLLLVVSGALGPDALDETKT